jgi:N6-adenosine-specific RNA methylase IME4
LGQNSENSLLSPKLNLASVSRRFGRRLASRKREHSRKPDKLYPIIEACSRGPFLELFACGSRPGWASWGQEVAGPILQVAAE